jgi:hypothetical protein
MGLPPSKKHGMHTANGSCLTEADVELFVEYIKAGHKYPSAAAQTQYDVDTFRAAARVGNAILRRLGDPKTANDVTEDERNSIQLHFVRMEARAKSDSVKPVQKALWLAATKDRDVRAIKMILESTYPEWRVTQQVEQTTTHKFESIEEAEAEARKGLEELGLSQGVDAIDITQRESDEASDNH